MSSGCGEACIGCVAAGVWTTICLSPPSMQCTINSLRYGGSTVRVGQALQMNRVLAAPGRGPESSRAAASSRYVRRRVPLTRAIPSLDDVVRMAGSSLAGRFWDRSKRGGAVVGDQGASVDLYPQKE
jgi:hypothetical protein